MPLRIAMIISICLLVLGCTKQKVADPTPTGDPADLNAPDAETLAKSPCGNPDWSEPPPGPKSPEN